MTPARSQLRNYLDRTYLKSCCSDLFCNAARQCMTCLQKIFLNCSDLSTLQALYLIFYLLVITIAAVVDGPFFGIGTLLVVHKILFYLMFVVTQDQGHLYY